MLSVQLRLETTSAQERSALRQNPDYFLQSRVDSATLKAFIIFFKYTPCLSFLAVNKNKSSNTSEILKELTISMWRKETYLYHILKKHAAYILYKTDWNPFLMAFGNLGQRAWSFRTHLSIGVRLSFSVTCLKFNVY